MFLDFLKPKPKSLGLALGSGEWRGLAHIGVLKVLEQNKIPISYIAGTSAGALIGGLYAALGNYTALENIVNDLDWKTFLSNLADPKLTAGLIQGNRFTNYLHKYIGDVRIEDLKIPFCAVCTDIYQGQTVFLNKGSLKEAIRASISIPLLFHPVEYESHYLVDGGLTDPVPVKYVRDQGLNYVLAVDLFGNTFPLKTEPAKKLTLLDITQYTTLLLQAKLSNQQAKEADFIVEPLIDDGSLGSLFNFVTKKDTIGLGEEAMKKHLTKLKRRLRI